MRHPVEVITFDFYGTLVQWHEALSATAEEVFARHGRPATAAADMVHAFHVEGRRLRDAATYQPYRAILRESWRVAMEGHGLSMSEADVAGLLSRVARIPPHPEVPAVLRQLQQHHRLAAISNTDDDLIAGSLDLLGVALDGVITAQQARAYKPNPALFRHAHQVLGVDPDGVLHVAASQALDLTVCKAMGIRAIWVNRRGETLDKGLTPLGEVTDLTGLPSLIPS